MPEYRFKRWRRVVFAAVLIVVLVVTLGPSISQGTVNVRVVGTVPPGVIIHVYVKFTSVQLHTAGFPEGSGLVTLSQLLPRIDLVQGPVQLSPDALISAHVSSGRYDTIILQAENGTIVMQNGQTFPVTVTSVVRSGARIPIAPNRSGDVLVVLDADYVQLISAPPAITLSVVQAVGA